MLIPAADRTVHLAVSTGSFWPHGTLAAIDVIRLVPHQTVELTLQAGEFRLRYEGGFDEDGLQQIAHAITAAGLVVCSLHGPYIEADHMHSLGARLAYLERAVRLARDFGATVVTTHPFHLFTSYEAANEYVQGERPSLSSALLPGLDRLFGLAEQLGVTIALENIRVFADDRTGFFNLSGPLLRFLNEVDSPAVGLTLDVLHASLGQTLDEMLERLAAHIVCVQLSDLSAERARAPLGRGIVPWATVVPVLSRLPRLQVLTLELVRATPEHVRESVDHVRQYWPSDAPGLL